MNLPIEFLQMMEEQIGKEETEKLVDAIGTASPTSIRTNPNKQCTDVEDSALDMPYDQVRWCERGRMLKERPSFTFDPLFHAGAYYVQEASSMYIEHIIKKYVEGPVMALDLCAAPGGKTTLALSNLADGSFLIANEVMRNRCQILAENITKWGNSNTIVTNNYAEDFAPMGQIFDLIICDAPCSGEGMFRKDEGAINDWSLNNVDVCWNRQREIVQNIWPCLKPGGVMIYSTCTYNRQEDEETVEWIAQNLGADILPLCDEKEWNITNGHFFPHKTVGEGFYVCPLRKKENDEEEIETGKGKKNKGKGAITPLKANSPEAKELSAYLKTPGTFTLYELNDDYYAFPAEFMDILQKAKSCLKVVHSGIKLANKKGKNIQPDHSLAMSLELNRDAFPNVELTKDEAIAYLRTEAISVEAPKGYILLTYKGLPLGFGKNIGNRVNNLYPSEWKIRKNY